MSLIPSSLRNRLVLAGVVVGFVFAVLFGVTATWRVHHAETQAVRAALQSRLELARDQVGPNGTLTQDAGSPQTDLVQIVGPDGLVRSSSPALSNAPPLIDIARVRRSAGGVQSAITLQQPDIDLAVLAVPLHLNATTGSSGGTGALVVAVDAEGFNAATSGLLGLLIGGLTVVVLAMGALSWVLTGRALRSVTRLTESAEVLEPQRLAAGLPLPQGDAELARLVAALNRMLVRLHESHLTELTFAADAGHRLRTPVATLRAEAELALRERDPHELSAALERIVNDADQLTSIVDRMLSRSRAHEHTPAPVLEALEEAGTRWHRQAALSSIVLSLTIDPAITPQTRCLDLIEVMEPIFDNANRFTPARGHIDIDVHLDPDPSPVLVVDIGNTGPGITDEVAAQLFNAWVSSRDASVAGGLGLWLARETARDLGGDVELVDAEVGTTAFRIVLPTITAD